MLTTHCGWCSYPKLTVKRLFSQVHKTVKSHDSPVSIALGFSQVYKMVKSHDSSVGIVLGYGLDTQGSRVQLLAGAGNFSLHHHVQNGSGAHPASYPMGTRGFFPGHKAVGA
jgi:hypothetical protein